MHSPTVTRRLLAASALSMLAVGNLLLNGASLVSAQSLFVSDSFANSTTDSPNWTVPSAPDGDNLACLTASTNATQTPVPGCDLTSPDADGSGALRFTSASDNEEGGVTYALSIPTQEGIDASFDSYQYDGNSTPADGISFFLAAVNPQDPTPVTAIGQPGGDLGYSACLTSLGCSPSGTDSSPDGMTDGYLGIGVDVYGNFTNPDFDGTGCTDPSWAKATPGQVTVRGPGSGSVGYCLLNSTAATDGGGKLDLSGSTRADSDVPVEVVVNTSSSILSIPASTNTPITDLTVPALSYEIAFIPVGGSQQTLTGALPLVPEGLLPSSWVNSSGLPYQLDFGWVASTGGSTDIHEINNIQASSATDIQLPVLTTSLTSSPTTVYDNTTLDYQAGVTVSSTGGPEDEEITATDTFPSGLTPLSTGLGGTGWSCSLSGQTATCTYPPGTGIAAGTALPNIAMPVTVTAAPGDTFSDTFQAVSDDAGQSASSQSTTVAYPPTTTSLTSTVNPSTVAGSTTLTAAVTGTSGIAPTGTVEFESAGTPISDCSAQPLSDTDIATCTAAFGSASAGLSLSAVYSGDDSNAPSTGTLNQVVTQTNSSTTLSTSPNPSVNGQSVTLSAQVDGPGVEPTGTVGFYSAGEPISNCEAQPVNSSGLANCGTTFGVGESPVHLTATYSGDGNYFGSASDVISLVVNLATAGLSLASSDNPSTTGASTTFTATATQVGGLPLPTGSVEFQQNSVDLPGCSAVPLDDGVATCTTAKELAAASPYAIVAVYGGDGNYQGAVATLTQDVEAAPTATNLTISPGPYSVNAPVTLTATVSLPNLSESGIYSEGEVEFLVNGTPVNGCTAIPLSEPAEQAVCDTSFSSAGSNDVAAQFLGDGNYLSSLGTVGESVALDTATNVISVSPNPTTTGASVTITDVISGAYGTPTGTVTVYSDSAPINGCEDVPLQSGQATCSTSFDASQPQDFVDSTYGGDGAYGGAPSQTVTEDVNLASPNVTLTSSVNPSQFGQDTVLSATVGAVGAGPTPTGSVAFEDNGNVITNCSSQQLSSGVATCSASFSVIGTAQDITAAYGGDPNYDGAISNTVVQDVVPLPSTLTLTPQVQNVVTGQGDTVQAVVTSAITPSGTVDFSSDGTPVAGCQGVAISGLGEADCASIDFNSGVDVAPLILATFTSASPDLADSEGVAVIFVSPAGTTTTLTSSSNPVPVGASTILTATVSPVAPGTGLPSGTVTFYDGTQLVCATDTTGTVAATCDDSFAAAGVNHSITAVFVPASTSGFLGSTSPALNQTVATATASVQVSSSSNASVTGQAVVLTATVGGDHPTGTVTFLVNGTALPACADVGLGAEGIATCDTSFTASGGPYQITATYSGDSNNSAATSGEYSQIVTPDPTTTSISPTSPVQGQSPVAAVAVSPDAPGSGVPTGTVSITGDGGCTATLVGGSGSCTLSGSAETGTLDLTATYSGDGNFLASTGHASIGSGKGPVAPPSVGSIPRHPHIPPGPTNRPPPELPGNNHPIVGVRLKTSKPPRLSKVSSKATSKPRAPKVTSSSAAAKASSRVRVRWTLRSSSKIDGGIATITGSGKIADLEVNWGDGTTTRGILEGDSVHGQHRYSRSGSYRITITFENNGQKVSFSHYLAVKVASTNLAIGGTPWWAYPVVAVLAYLLLLLGLVRKQVVEVATPSELQRAILARNADGYHVIAESKDVATLFRSKGVHPVWSVAYAIFSLLPWLSRFSRTTDRPSRMLKLELPRER